MLCPGCGAKAHRSHSHNLGERLIKSFTRYRIYRCHQCGWRGRLWRAKGQSEDVGLNFRAVLGVIITIIITLIIIFYLAGSLSRPTPPGE